MSRVITFSRLYPAYHPKAGQPTHFVEKVWKSLYKNGKCPDELSVYINKYCECFFEDGLAHFNNIKAKGHTVRKGNRWKKGDYFSPAVWGNNVNPKSGRSGPYHSSQVKFAPDIEVKRTYTFDLMPYNYILIDGKFKIDINNEKQLENFARNDGLLSEDLLAWFKYPKPVIDHQIICWNENINY